MRPGGQQFYLGTFTSARDAAVAYDLAAIAVWGTDAVLNARTLSRLLCCTHAHSPTSPQGPFSRFFASASAWTI